MIVQAVELHNPERDRKARKWTNTEKSSLKAFFFAVVSDNETSEFVYVFETKLK